jgi:hypothetical protein
VVSVEKLKARKPEEIRQLCQTHSKTLLMGCDEAQFRAVLADLVQRLQNPYQNR